MKVIKYLLIFYMCCPVITKGQSNIDIGNGTELNIGTGAEVCADSHSGSGVISGEGHFCGGSSALALTVIIQGFYDANTDIMIRDTLRVYLRSTSYPYGVVDSAKGYLNTGGNVTLNFPNAINGVNYYIQLKHRNSIETWSGAGQSFINSQLTYDFSTSGSQAFGSNMIQVDTSPIRYAIYSGDVNQDRIIDGGDLSLVDNDAFNSVSGYVQTDLNGDNFVDGSDLSIVDNNVFNGVIVVRP